MLQDIALGVHPPSLYFGYVGFSLCFSYAIAMLLASDFSKKHFEILKKIHLISFALLTTGIFLGSWWAYRELGWGGFWSWGSYLQKLLNLYLVIYFFMFISTGIDLVEEMLRVAEGKKLRLKKNKTTFNGWAFESRVYAEDPTKNFLPTSGFVTECRFCDIARIESGIQDGATLTLCFVFCPQIPTKDELNSKHKKLKNPIRQ